VHPLAWLVWVVSAGIVVLLTTNPFYLLPLVAAAWLVHATHRLPGAQGRSFRIFLLFGCVAICTRTVLVVFGGIVTRESVAAAALEGLRLAVLLVLFGTFNSVSDPFRILRLAPRRWHEPALAAALALSLTPRTIDSVARVREAQRLRGMDVGRWRSWAALAVPVLETGLEEAGTLAESMDARGHGRGRRSTYRPDPWHFSSRVVALIAGATAIAFALAARAGIGDLMVSTYPVRWPDVNVGLVVVCLLFGVPGFLPGTREGK
jgi:energy-coupling factor transport system permease protein